MKSIIFLCINLLSIAVLSQQNFQYQIKINWQHHQKITKPYFTNRHYFDTLPGVPFHYKIVEIPANSTVKKITYNNVSFKHADNRYQHLLSNQTPKQIQSRHKIVNTRKKTKLHIWTNAAVNQNGNYVLLDYTDVNVQLTNPGSSPRTISKKSYAQSSVLSTGDWQKIKIQESGIYKITYNQLENWGFDNPEDIRVYGFGGRQLSYRVAENHPDGLPEVPLWIEKGNDGVFNSGDYVLFYGEGIVNRYVNLQNNKIRPFEHNYTTYGHYFITTSLGAGARVQTVNYNDQNHAETHNIFTDMEYLYFRENNLNKTGRIFFGEIMQSGDTKDFTFHFPNLETNKTVNFHTRVGAICSGTTSYFYCSLNDNNFKQIGISQSGTYDKGRSSSGSQSLNVSSDEFTISLQYMSSNVTAEGYIGHVTVSASREMKYTDEQMIMQDMEHIGQSTLIKYEMQDFADNGMIWHISNGSSPQNIALQRNNNTTSYKYITDDRNMFIAFEKSDAMEPENAGSVNNQNLHAADFHDLFIVTHPDFREQAEELADFHRNHDNISVMVVEPELIYNEFSSGNRDVSAIRNFIKMFYDQAQNENQMPKHLLLFGDGSFDNISEGNNNNYIPTYQTKKVSGSSSVACDDFFVMLDAGEGGDEHGQWLNGTLDMGIGRFPVSNTQQAETMITKTIDYINNPNLGRWKNDMVFIGDDPDPGDQYLQENTYELATIIRDKYKWMNPELILMDAYPQESTPAGERYPEVTKAINAAIHRGALIFNYTGHGSETRLAHEAILDINTVKSWTNEKLPFFMTGSCEISRFDMKTQQSLGEAILLEEDGGAISLFSTTRVVYGFANQSLSENFYNLIFEPNQDGSYKTLGQIIMKTKNRTGGGNMRNFALFGDPALRLDVPPKRVVTDSVNGTDAQNYTDTLKALKKITIYGHIADSSRKDRISFNGTIYPMIFDKLKKKQTLNNEGTGEFSYYEFSNIIYKGKATVENGTFEFEFIVPIDINYEFGPGKISYYAENGEIDAYGHFNNFLVGGSDSLLVDDNQGPEIDLYLNDTTFISGGTVNESPLLLAHIRDQYGINTTGNVIGHDLTATLNNDLTNKIILNDFYENDLNSYQSGKVEYQLLNLDEGLNTLELKAWDILNNSSTAYTEFIVANSQEVVLKHVLNYPNPFSTKTKFIFEHNQPNQIVDVRIQIFTISGKLIKTLETSVTGTQYMNNPIVWDGRDDFGDKIGRGVYIYKVRLSTPDGKSGEKFEKLVILR